ncbi:helix-turn-helix transcriptional regulator [Arthrobacter crystallopoietes]|uniref:Helix-turn-helix domain-containing protein n=1 Tax=Crystallibacter crystallopoietes TaxID=37928 RepID=A0A1H0XL59_9MICC|nr:Helix-turn-helix domain-containing protein [Arthrobacter crystallopoietes]
MTDSPARRRFLKLDEVMDILNISRAQTYALVRSGDLQGIQIGGRNYLQFKAHP